VVSPGHGGGVEHPVSATTVGGDVVEAGPAEKAVMVAAPVEGGKIAGDAEKAAEPTVSVRGWS